MARRSKRYLKAAELIDSAKLYTLEDAVGIIKNFPDMGMDESVDLAVNLAVDPKHADQMVRGTVVLPHGLGRSKKVIVIASGEKQKEAQDAGADDVGGEEIVKKIQGGWMDFEAVVATPEMKREVGKLGRVLGPRGLMPNPKTGTVTKDIGKAVKNAKTGQIRYRADKSGIVHGRIGDLSFSSCLLYTSPSPRD